MINRTIERVKNVSTRENRLREETRDFRVSSRVPSAILSLRVYALVAAMLSSCVYANIAHFSLS